MKKQVLIMTAIAFLTAAAAADAWNPDQMLNSYLRQHYPWTRIEVTDVTFDEDPPHNPPLAVSVEKNIPGRAVFTFEFESGKRIRATAMVKAFDPVVMSRKPLNKGSVLQKDDVYTALMDTARMPKSVVTHDEQIFGKTLSRAIGANHPITESMVSAALQVKKGKKVMLIVDSPTFTVKTTGELQQNGVVGSFVKVINLLSHKAITGLLVDEQTVKVGL